MSYQLSLVEAAAALHTGAMSCADYASALIARADETAHLNAIITLDRDGLMAAAREADDARARGEPLGPLHGLPIGIKDNIHVAGLPNTAGSAALKSFVPKRDAPVVAALRRAGAIPFAKLNMHELASGLTSINPVFGDVGNPHAPECFPGGSSGGCGAALGAQTTPGALGTDTGGSVRIPAALCGVVGFRPSTGRYPLKGVTPLSATRDTVGPMAREVADVALLDAALTGADEAPAIAPERLRLGVPRHYFLDGVDRETRAAFNRALAALTGAGVDLVDVALPALEQAIAGVALPISLYEIPRELRAYLDRYDVGLTLEELLAQVSAPDVAVLARGLIDGTLAVSDAVYHQAVGPGRDRLRAMIADAHAKQGIAALIFPTTPTAAQPTATSVETISIDCERRPTLATMLRSVDPAAVMGAPAISVPMGRSPAGLPLGLELDGLPGADADLLAAARTVEAVLRPLASSPAEGA